MARAQSPKDIVDQWLASYQSSSHRSDEDMVRLRRELARLNERQLWRFLDWLGERRVRQWRCHPAAPGGETKPASDTHSTRLAGFGLPRLHGGASWRSRPRRTRHVRHGMSA